MDEPELVAGAEFVEMMAKSGLYARGPLGIKEPDAIQIFATGKSAMFWGGQWMRRSIRAAYRRISIWESSPSPPSWPAATSPC